MGDAPSVSVVIPCFEAAEFVRDAIDSALTQPHADVEVLVVNDGSPDADELRSALPADPRVRFLDEPHRGLAGARNAGIREARGALLAFLDADDAWLPTFLGEQTAFLAEEDADLVYCDAVFFGGTEKDGRTVMEWDSSEGPVSMESVLAGRCVPVMSTILARAEAVRSVGGFDEARDFAEDFELWVRMLAAGCRFAYRRETGARRRLHDHNMSYDTEGMAGGQVEVIDQNLGRVGDDHPLRSAILDRRRDLRRAVHLAGARRALEGEDHVHARRALWNAARTGGSPKHWIGAVALTLAPSLAMPFLRRRLS